MIFNDVVYSFFNFCDSLFHYITKLFATVPPNCIQFKSFDNTPCFVKTACPAELFMSVPSRKSIPSEQPEVTVRMALVPGVLATRAIWLPVVPAAMN